MNLLQTPAGQIALRVALDHFTAAIQSGRTFNDIRREARSAYKTAYGVLKAPRMVDAWDVKECLALAYLKAGLVADEFYPMEVAA